MGGEDNAADPNDVDASSSQLTQSEVASSAQEEIYEVCGTLKKVGAGALLFEEADIESKLSRLHACLLVLRKREFA